VTSTPTARPSKHDPFWDMDGRGVRRVRMRQRIVGGLAFLTALAACCATAFAWAAEVGFVDRLHLG
jgi:hypothetical protein